MNLQGLTAGIHSQILIYFITPSMEVLPKLSYGDKADVTAKIQAKHPVILDILPLTLEEVFTYEMEALGYSFDDVLVNN